MDGFRRLTEIKGGYLFLFLAICSILLQKVSVPFYHSLSINTVILPCSCIFGLVSRSLRIQRKCIPAFGLFITIAVISFIINSADRELSISSIALLVISQSTLCLRSAANEREPVLIQAFSDIVFVTAILGIIQFSSQHFVGIDKAFFFDFALPNYLRVDTYNSLNPLAYGSDTLKSNGVFYAEPSYFSQFVAIAIITEVTQARRIARLALLCAALYCSYSGTGMITLGIFGSVIAIRERRADILAAAALIAGILLALGSVLNVEAITDRLSEISTPGSSGYSRFISIFVLISRYQLADIVTFLLGVGSGSISSFIRLLPYEGFDPTWGKLFFEYGCLGLVTYLLFMSNVTRLSASPLKFPLLVTYFVMGGYLLDSTIITALLVSVVYLNGEEGTSVG